MANNFSFTNTYGLVVCGGKSSRMGTDKSMLQYFDKPQRYHIYNMLVPLFEKVFISCNAEQAKNIEPCYQYIKDDENFGDIGPMISLLTAFTQFPNKNILLIGCDYPFLTADELQAFASFCKDEPAAFYNEADVVYEPMLGWYPFGCFEKLKIMFDGNQFSLQQFLKQNQGVKFLPKYLNSIKSIDTDKAFREALKKLNAG